MDGITDSMDMSLSKVQERVKERGAWHGAAHGVTELDSTERLKNNKVINTKEIRIKQRQKVF